MAGTLTVVVEGSNSPPRVRLQVSGMGGSTVTIQRTNADGTTYAVRTANPGSLATAAFYDYESPWAQAGSYTATSDSGDTATTAVAAVKASMPLPGPWLIHVGIPALSTPITIQTIGDRSRDVNQGVHLVLGRVNPIVRTDGVRRAATYDLTIRTATDAEDNAVSSLLASSRTLLLQWVTPNLRRVRYEYVSVGAVTSSYLETWFGSTYLVWTLPCTVTAAPAGLLQAQWSCAGLLATYSTAQAATQAYATCTDMLINNPRLAA